MKDAAMSEKADAELARIEANVAEQIEQKDKRIIALEAEVSDLQRELRQEKGLKALLANGMPPTGNPDFDTVLATQPVAAMIQRGWLPGITGFDDLPALESAICHFWEVATIAEAVNPQALLPSFIYQKG